MARLSFLVVVVVVDLFLSFYVAPAVCRMRMSARTRALSVMCTRVVEAWPVLYCFVGVL